MVYVDGEITPTYKHESKEQAEKEAKILSEKLGKETYILEAIASVLVENDITKRVDSFEKACEYLEIKHAFACCPSDNKHHKAMVSLFKLVTIAEAWNKADDFVPDYSNRNQYKYYPWFQYNDKAAGFVYAHTTNSATAATAFVGSRLCFKTESRAKQFGEQFIDLWNDFLLFR